MDAVVKRVLAGDVRAVARLIGDIEDGHPEAWEILKKLFPHTGNAHIIGVTGFPGVGKSTLVDQLVERIRDRGRTVGVLAIDPTSPFSGGAILGDRIRMQRHGLDKSVYMRSMASRGYLGGLSRATRGAIDVLDAMGKKIIVVETVGVGQDEVMIAKNAHTTVVVLAPGLGDEIQAIKAGILEVGDIFVINKSDRMGAEAAEIDLKQMIAMADEKFAQMGWTPPVVKTQAQNGKGLPDLMAGIDQHGAWLQEGRKDQGFDKKKAQVRDMLLTLIKDRLVEKVTKALLADGLLDHSVDAVLHGKTDPYTACDQLCDIE